MTSRFRVLTRRKGGILTSVIVSTMPETVQDDNPNRETVEKYNVAEFYVGAHLTEEHAEKMAATLKATLDDADKLKSDLLDNTFLRRRHAK